MRFSQNDLHFSVEMVAVELGQFPPDILIINLSRLPNHYPIAVLAYRKIQTLVNHELKLKISKWLIL